MILHLVECCIWQQRTGLPLNRRMTTAATWHACKMWHAYACLPDVILSNHAVLEAKRQSMPGCVMPAHSCRGETEITLAPQSHMYTHTSLSVSLTSILPVCHRLYVPSYTDGFAVPELFQRCSSHVCCTSPASTSHCTSLLSSLCHHPAGVFA